MRVTILGGNGYVGSQLTRILLQNGFEVTVMDKYVRPSLDVFPSNGWINRPTLIDMTGDICNPLDVKMAIKDADIIVHLAAIVGTPACDDDPKLAWEVNAIGTRVIALCRTPDQPIIFASTGNVYGAVTEELCTEYTLVNPLTVYAMSKAEAECSVLPNGIVLRFTTGFGVSPKMRYDALINNWVDIASKKGKLDVYQPDAIRSFIDVFDMASAIYFMINHMNEYKGEIFNVGNESINVQKKEIAKKIDTFLTCDISFVSGPIDKDARDYVNSFEKLAKTGFKPQISLDLGIHNLVRKIARS